MRARILIVIALTASLLLIPTVAMAAIAEDGWYGPVTEAAVVDFQRSNGLLVDGIVGPQTKGALGLSTDGRYLRHTSPRMNGGDVLTVQQRLNNAGASASSAPSTPTVQAASNPSSVSGLDGIAREIARCESGLNPRAENPTSSASGLFQFISSTWESVTGKPAPASAYPVSTQIDAFYKLWDDGAGASHWAPSAHCWS